jgi:CheY-like chemotaxis protein
VGEDPVPDRLDTEVRIVVVDDDPANVELLRRMLGRAGYGNVVTTNDPAEAIELCVAERTALLLLDLHMPGVDGFEVMAAVLARAPGLRIIVFTGDASPAVAGKALGAGAGSVLIKPFEYDELLRQVADQIGGVA